MDAIDLSRIQDAFGVLLNERIEVHMKDSTMMGGRLTSIRYEKIHVGQFPCYIVTGLVLDGSVAETIDISTVEDIVPVEMRINAAMTRAMDAVKAPG